MGSYEKFAGFYDLIYKDIVNYEREADDLEKIFAEFGEHRTKQVLDVACGTGSHSLILAERGYEVTGIDSSEMMIREAKKKASKKNIHAEFFVQDMRSIKLDKKFDCSICMFGGMGYILTRYDLACTFSSLKQHLRDEGLLIFEFWSVGGVKPTPFQSWIKVQKKGLTVYRLSESNFDPQTNVLTIDFHFIALWANKPVETFSETHKIRCYTLAEMKQYLEDCGFALVSAIAYDVQSPQKFEEPRKETFRVLTVAQRK